MGSVTEQSRVMQNISNNAKLKNFPALAQCTSGLGFKVFKVKTQNNNKTDGTEFPKKCVNSTTGSNNRDCLQLSCSSCSRKFRLTFLALRRKESSSVRQNIRLPKTKIFLEVKMIS